RGGSETRPIRDRRGETLFIDARKMGTLIDRVHRELTDEDIAKIAGTYHAWRGDPEAVVTAGADGGAPVGARRAVPLRQYADIPGFCKSATLDEIRNHGHVLTPGRYVGAANVEDDGEPFDEKMARLTAQLREQMAQARELDNAVWKNLQELGYGR
ncbi:MAG: N-6 DNA methylase, partial [Dehalococcoidia bacterium]